MRTKHLLLAIVQTSRSGGLYTGGQESQWQMMSQVWEDLQMLNFQMRDGTATGTAHL